MEIKSLVLILTGNVEQHAHRRHSYNYRSISTANKRQRQPCRRNCSAHHERIYGNLNSVHESKPRSEQISEPVFTVCGDFKAPVNYKTTKYKENQKSNKAELFAHNGKNEVAFGKRQKPVFLRGIEQPRTKQSAGAERIQRLN